MIFRALLLCCLTATPVLAQERAFPAGTYGEPFTVEALVDGCSSEGEAAGCMLISEGARWLALANGPTPPELLAQLAGMPVNSPVIVNGDVVTMGDITVEAVLAGIAPGTDPHAAERAAIQGDWQGEDPGFVVKVRGSGWTETYQDEVMAEHLLTLDATCAMDGLPTDGLTINLQMLGGDMAEQTCFVITSLTPERMELLHLPRGNMVTFIRATQ